MVQMARHPISDNAWRCCLNLQLLLINLSANDNLMTGRQTPLTHGHMYALSRCPWLTCHGQQRDCVAGRLGLQCVLCAFFDSCSRTIHAHDGLFEVNNIRRPASKGGGAGARAPLKYAPAVYGTELTTLTSSLALLTADEVCAGPENGFEKT